MSKTKITGKVLAIQLGRAETQIVLMANGSEILHGITVPTPAGAVEDGAIRNPDAVREMLKAALQEPEFKRVNQAVFSLCTSQVITETVTTPDLPAAKLEKLLQANVDMYFPVDMQDYQLVWQVIGPKAGDGALKELDVQLWAVPTAMVSRYYHVANACGLSVAAIDYCGNSVASAVGATFSRTGKAARERKKVNLNSEITFGRKKAAAEPAAAEAAPRQVPETNLHITLEKDLLGMTFVQAGRVVFQRFIRCGADPSYQFGELAMMLEYFRSLDVGRGSYVSGILSGSLTWDKQLNDELTDALGIAITTLNGDFDPRWTLCAGAVRTTLDFGMPALNKPGRARKHVQTQLWQYVLVLVGGLALVGIILLTLSSRLVWDANIRSLENTMQTLSIQAQKTAGYADNYNSYAAKYDSYSADWDTVFGNLQVFNDNLVLVLEELEKTLPENTSVTNLQIAADGMAVQFACETKEEAAYLIMALRDLQYADLMAISNLYGGGAGPATSYGSGETGTEEAPTEGSGEVVSVRIYARSATSISSLIASELSREELMDLGLSLKPEQIDLLEQTYGKQPATSHSSLSELKQSSTFGQRSDAVTQMLTTNPFAANGFLDLLEEDFNRGTNSAEVILWWHILDDIVRLEKEGKLDMGASEDPEKLAESIEILMDVLTQDEETLAATEALICTNDTMEKNYIHYLEVEMGLRSAETFPYLNMDKVISDLLSGGFNTGDSALDAKLNAMISDETWALLDKVNSEEDIAALVEQYLTTGTTGEPLIDGLIDSYLTTGTTGIGQLDSMIGEFLASDRMKNMLDEKVDAFLNTGSTGSTVTDDMINNFLTTGSTGYAKLDSLAQEYMAGGQFSDKIKALIEKYMSEQTTGNAKLDELISCYLTTGTTGNAQLDALIKEYLKTGEGGDDSSGDIEIDDDMLATILDMLERYKNDGTTGNTTYDMLLYQYLSKGTTGSSQLDAAIAQVRANYSEIDQWIKNYRKNNSVNDALNDLANLGNGTGTGGTGVVDTRIFFTASLGYNEELINAELTRKGLSPDDKIEKVEVDA